ncbi:conserved hypothetical protein [Burkholderia pseudomallei 1106b]|uniref:Uncharacterized protein n=1 Tax=Burkholderia pseudomallei (strain 1106a) TaxID=357348 RepID=A3P3D8_BURP0|nr:conserved hypothetical protein [Burkholderia pseudomallei 1106a]AFR18790.1 hypothetical protein BPC006_II0859 [Burkholderia pseudomallei BPC006]EES23577.1 conserved hypothetical protein [Burkholderia pseudomallei 1106b]
MGRYTLNRRFAPSAGRTLAPSHPRSIADSSIRRVGTRAAAPPARDSVRHVARMPRSRRHAVVGLKSDAHVKAARMRAASASHDAALRCASAPSPPRHRARERSGMPTPVFRHPYRLAPPRAAGIRIASTRRARKLVRHPASRGSAPRSRAPRRRGSPRHGAAAHVATRRQTAAHPRASQDFR